MGIIGRFWKHTKAVAKRFHLIAALAVLLILMFLFWIGSLLLEDYVVSRVKEANLSHHWDLYTRFMYLVTNYPVRSAIVLTCVFLVASELHIRAKSHPIWKALFGDDERQEKTAEAEAPRNAVSTSPSQLQSAVNVKLTPSQGQSDRMYLEVTNLGEKQTFHAQCRVLARRNDPNPQRLLTLDLGWVRKGRELEIHRGETCSLYVARSGQDRPLRDIEWIEIVGSPEPVQSQWAIGQVTPLPEYDVEIVIFGGENQEPYSEKFTIRAGRECALEMFKLKTNSEVRETAKQSFPNQLQERGPHIVFLGADTMWLRQDQDHDSRLLIFRDTQGQHGDVYGAVACFRNDPAQSATAYGLRANLRLMDSQGSEIGRGIPGGCWLDETTDLIDLKPDESACVLANNGKWTIPWKERRQTGLNEDSISDRTFALTGLPITVEIRLRDRDGNLRLGPLAIGIALVNGHITVTARQPS